VTSVRDLAAQAKARVAPVNRLSKRRMSRGDGLAEAQTTWVYISYPKRYGFVMRM